jgi:hypothetical protein
MVLVLGIFFPKHVNMLRLMKKCATIYQGGWQIYKSVQLGPKHLGSVDQILIMEFILGNSIH